MNGSANVCTPYKRFHTSKRYETLTQIYCVHSNGETIEGKNGLRNYQFESVQRDKSKSIYDPYLKGFATETWYGMFYKKKCSYCNKDFDARRVDTAFCCQSCQKAHLRLRRRNL